MTTEVKINYKEYPECMFAMIASFLSPNEGIDLRRVAGDVVFRSESQNGNTYRNGLLHSFDDIPAVVSGGRQEWYKDGLLHREGDRPAVVSEGSYKQWWVNGVFVRYDEVLD